MRQLIALVFAAVLAACATAPTPDAPAYSAQDTLTLERTRCFGFCPDYTVTINGEGAVTYNGRGFVRVTGAQTGQADPAEVARLFSSVEADGFFDLRDEYRAHITDMPTFRVTYVRAGRRKTVTDYAGTSVGMPRTVRQIEDAIDRVANTAQWVPREPGAPAAR